MQTTINSPQPKHHRSLILPLARAVFFDRDGVLTRERDDYVKSPEELEILPGIYGPLRAIREKGFRIVVITNQSVVGRGLATPAVMERIHAKLRHELEKNGCHIDAIYYCPHLPGAGCDCRKPKPGLIFKAASELGIDPKRSWLIGDKEIDMQAAEKAGCRGLRVSTNGDGLAKIVGKILASDESNEQLEAS